MNFKFKHLTYPVRKAVTLTIEPVFPQIISADARYTLSLRPFSGLRLYGLRNQPDAPTKEDAAFFDVQHELTISGNTLKLEAALPQEDCYLCKLFIDGVQAETMEIYALEDDLFDKTPFRGDNHMHTYMSDGRDTPMYMAAASCRLGNDYCVITDHKKREPSIIARDFFKDTGVDFLIIPGEEVHSPDNLVHIINIGGSESVNDWWRDHENEYRAAVEAELEKMPEPMLDEARYMAAASQVMFDRIRSVDGVSVLCHPNWILPSGFNEAEDITDYLFDHKRFDMLELIAGGAYEVGTQMQISYYQNRDSMPILGNSDAHSTFGGRLEPGNYTIVFADALDAEAIKSAMRAGRTIAGDANKLYGDYRLVKYGYFLLRNYYPANYVQREQLGSQMMRLASSQEGPDSERAQKLLSPRPSENFKSLRYCAE